MSAIQKKTNLGSLGRLCTKSVGLWESLLQPSHWLLAKSQQSWTRRYEAAACFYMIKVFHEVYQLHLACERVHVHSMCWASCMAQTKGSDGQSISQLLFNPCGIIAPPQIIALDNLQAWHHKHDKRLYNEQSTQLTYHLLWDNEIDPLNRIKQTPIFLILYMHSNRCLRNQQKPGHKLLLLLALNEHLVWGDAHVHVGELVSILLLEVVNQESHLSATN